jgi:predicted PurR-regulated permease PerM
MGKDPTSRTILAILAIGGILWLLSLVADLLPPFLIAFALASLMNRVVQRFQDRGLSRRLALALTFASFLAIFAAAIGVLLPLAAAQSANLGSNIQSYYSQIVGKLTTLASKPIYLLRRYNLPPPTFEQVLTQYQGEISHALQQLLNYLLIALRGAASRLIWIVIIPVVSLYTVIDFPRISARVQHLIPSAHRDVVLNIINAVNRVFLEYLQGLILVCIYYGIAQGVVLGLIFQLQYAIVLALVGGILYAVPYIGPVATIALAAMVAWATGGGGLGYTFGVAGAAFLINEIFDFVITPRVLSHKTGLHPILNIFALMVGGSLFGFMGLVFAVPVAASIKEVLSYFYPKLTEPLPGPPTEPDPSEPPAGV